MSSEKLHTVVIEVVPVFERIKSALNLKNDAALARVLDVSPKKLSVWKLRNFMPYELLVTLCRHYDLSLDWVVTETGRAKRRPGGAVQVAKTPVQYGSGFVFVPQMRGDISASGGLVPDNAVELKIAFRREWIERRGDPKNMSLIRVSGDSMEPTLQSGDLALVDHGRNYVDPHGGIYAISMNQTIMIKRIQVIPTTGKLRIISNNARYEPTDADPDQIRVDGKVIWFGREIER